MGTTGTRPKCSRNPPEEVARYKRGSVPGRVPGRSPAPGHCRFPVETPGSSSMGSAVERWQLYRTMTGSAVR